MSTKSMQEVPYSRNLQDPGLKDSSPCCSLLVFPMRPAGIFPHPRSAAASPTFCSGLTSSVANLHCCCHCWGPRERGKRPGLQGWLQIAQLASVLLSFPAGPVSHIYDYLPRGVEALERMCDPVPMYLSIIFSIRPAFASRPVSLSSSSCIFRHSSSAAI